MKMSRLKILLFLAVVFGDNCDGKKDTEEDDTYQIPPDFCLPPERIGFYGRGKLTYLEDCPDIGTLYPGLPMPANPYNKVRGSTEDKLMLQGIDSFQQRWESILSCAVQLTRSARWTRSGAVVGGKGRMRRRKKKLNHPMKIVPWEVGREMRVRIRHMIMNSCCMKFLCLTDLAIQTWSTELDSFLDW